MDDADEWISLPKERLTMPAVSLLTSKCAVEMSLLVGFASRYKITDLDLFCLIIIIICH